MFIRNRDDMTEVWTDIWNGLRGVEFSQESYVWRFYQSLIGSSFHGKKVLEIGCGTGVNTAIMAARGARVVFFDQSQAALDLAQKTMDAWGLDGEYIRGDAFDYSFAKEFDVVHSEGVVEHFLGFRRQQILQIHTDATKRGGNVVIIVPHAKCPGYRFGKWLAEQTGTWIYGGEYPYTATELRARLVRTGLEVTRVAGGELLFGIGWAFCPLWLHSRKLLGRAIAEPASARGFALNYNNRFADYWGRVIGCVGTKK